MVQLLELETFKILEKQNGGLKIADDVPKNVINFLQVSYLGDTGLLITNQRFFYNSFQTKEN